MTRFPGSSQRFARQLDEGLQIVNVEIGLPHAEENLLGDALPTQPDCGDVHFAGVFLHEPARQRGDAAAARHHLQHDVGGLDDLVAMGANARWHLFIVS